MAIRSMIALVALPLMGSGAASAQLPSSLPPPLPPLSAPPPPPSPPPPPPAVPVPPTPSAPPACADTAHRAFDFWVGEWDVFPNGSATQVATSSIEVMFGGCAIRETWKPFKGAGGGSFSHYDMERRHWRQAWVDSSGTRVDFDGGPVEGKMVLTGRWANVAGAGRDGLIRMTYSREAGGAVRQHGEQSLDHGLSWTTSFDFIYKPRKAGEN